MNTYNDIAEALFKNKVTYYSNSSGNIYHTNRNKADCPTNCYTEAQVKKLLALNKLFNVATYLNKTCSDSENSWIIVIKDGIIRVMVISDNSVSMGMPCFNTMELAIQAIKILGEEVIETALLNLKTN